jgi:predicted ATPase
MSISSNSLLIHIKQPNKSIPILPDFTLPSFTVLTGVNGSGKSHLFETISKQVNSDVTYNGRKIENIRFIGFNQLNPSIDSDCDPISISQRVKEIWTQVSEAKKRCGNQPRINEEIIPENNPIFPQIFDQNMRSLIAKISRNSRKPIGLITEDIIGEMLPNIGLNGNELFNSQFAMIFKAYQIHQIDNMLNKMYNDQGVKTDYLSNDEFVSKYGQEPWLFVDRILERLNLPYKVTNPERTRRESTFKFELINKENEIRIQSNDLSTGERTLMSLALAIYNTTNDLNKIDLLILDEPDAPLHPSMSKLMLDILSEDICEGHKIPVLLSTHSPTTIACTRPQSLYKISKTNKIPEPCSLDDSLSILAYEIPHLKLSVDSRRQVFVEHGYDVLYYEKLFHIIAKHISIDRSPQFLPPHSRNGANCSDVIEIVNNLRSKGNTNVYGLIDYDGKNRNSETIIVLGNEKRYAIENYVFEPHLLALYLIKKGFITIDSFGIEKILNYVQLCSILSIEILQSMANYISSQMGFIGEYTSSELINGDVLNIPAEYSVIRGHDLEDKIKSTWPILNSVRDKGDSSLKLDIINITIVDFPNLVSKDILWTFMQFK